MTANEHSPGRFVPRLVWPCRSINAHLGCVFLGRRGSSRCLIAATIVCLPGPRPHRRCPAPTLTVKSEGRLRGCPCVAWFAQGAGLLPNSHRIMAPRLRPHNSFRFCLLDHFSGSAIDASEAVRLQFRMPKSNRSVGGHEMQASAGKLGVKVVPAAIRSGQSCARRPVHMPLSASCFSITLDINPSARKSSLHLCLCATVLTSPLLPQVSQIQPACEMRRRSNCTTFPSSLESLVVLVKHS